jgi:hypothetical protein
MDDMADKLNIRSDAKDWRAKILANPAESPFIIGEFMFRCVEAPLQGIKFEDPAMRKEVFAMGGMEALRAGRKVTEAIKKGEQAFVYWQDEIIIYNSIEHRLLLAMFIHEKVRQNPKVQEALLSTEELFIFHDVGIENPNTSLPEKFYIEVLLAERRLLKKLKTISLRE